MPASDGGGTTDSLRYRLGSVYFRHAGRLFPTSLTNESLQLVLLVEASLTFCILVLERNESKQKSDYERHLESIDAEAQVDHEGMRVTQVGVCC